MSESAQRCVLVINGSQEMLELFQELISEVSDGSVLCHTRSLDDIHHVEQIRHLKPEVVLIDQPFGDRNLHGWDLVQKLRLARDLRNMPIIFMTTNVQLLQELDAQLTALNVRSLLKPFDPDHLIEQIKQAMKGAVLAPPYNTCEEDEAEDEAQPDAEGK